MAGENSLGRRIRQLRQHKSITRQQLADILGVDRSAIAAWETDRYAPRTERLAALAAALGGSHADLLASFPDAAANAPGTARLVDTLEEPPPLLVDLAKHTRTLRAFRLAAPYPTAAYVQTEWRNLVAERVLARDLDVQRIEIIYNLERLKELLSNIIRYDGCNYIVKGYAAGMNGVLPAMGGYMFDNEHFLLGAYWTGVPPTNKPGLLMTSEPFASFFNAYWNEIWSRGVPLNLRGKHHLSAVRKIAIELGLDPGRWKEFEEEAQALEIGDGAPPLV